MNQQRRMHKITVALNGTDVNPFHKMGLTQNPFPQTAKAEWDAMMLKLQSLGGDPIPNITHIRNTLKGFSPEFVELCCNKFQIGQMVKFEVEFPE